MSQENPFPDFMPKVGDLIRIISELLDDLDEESPDDTVEESLVLRRRISYGNFATKTLSIEVGTAVCDRYYWDEQKSVWYQVFHSGRTSSNYQIEVI